MSSDTFTGTMPSGSAAPGGDDRVAPSSRNISQVPYMPGLDGLRAIAVVAVMIYHANSDWLAGGYLGVEVFFVISGYLITLLLMAERERDFGAQAGFVTAPGGFRIDHGHQRVAHALLR